MTRLQESIVVRATPERIFDVALSARQIAGHANWNPTLARGVRVVQQTDGVGTAWEYPLEAPGAVARAEITGYEPPVRVRARMLGGIFRELLSEFTVEAIDQAHSRLQHRIAYRLRYQPVSAFVDIAVVRGKVRASALAGLLAMKERAELIERISA